MFFFKKILFILFLIKCSTSFANDKIAYLDVDFVIKNTNQGKIILSNLENVNKKNLSKFKLTEKNLEDERNNIRNVENIISNDEFQKKIDLFKENVVKYQKDKDKIIKEFNKKKEDELDTFIKKISPIIENYMFEKSITLLIDKNSVFIANPNHDITLEIVNIINEKLNL